MPAADYSIVGPTMLLQLMARGLERA